MSTILIMLAVLVGAAVAYALLQPKKQAQAPEAVEERPKKAPKKPAKKVDVTANLKKKSSKPSKAKALTEEYVTPKHALFLTDVRGHSDDLNDFDWTQDGKGLLSVSSDRTIRVWNFQDKKKPVYTRVNTKLDHASACAISRDGKIAVVALVEKHKMVQVFSIAPAQTKEGQPGVEMVLEFPSKHKDPIKNVLLSPLKTFIVTACEGQDTSIRIWSLRDGRLLHTLDTKQIMNKQTTLSGCGRFLAAGTMLSDVKIWKLSISQLGELEGVANVLALKKHSKGVPCLSFGTTEDGVTTRMATGSLDGGLRLWNVAVRYDVKEDARVVWEESPSQGPPELVAVAPGNSGVVVVAIGPRLCFYGVHGKVLGVVELAHRGGVRRLRWLGNGKVLASSGEDKAIKLWKSPAV